MTPIRRRRWSMMLIVRIEDRGVEGCRLYMHVDSKMVGRRPRTETATEKNAIDRLCLLICNVWRCMCTHVCSVLYL